MKVYVTSAGEEYAGNGVIGVYKTKKLAVKAALEVKPCFEGGWKKDSDNDYWTNGCDYVKVSEYKVEEK